ncbi:ribosomal protein L7/L12 [Nitrospina gracilis]|nr:MULTISPECIES: hypothetical protein [Nitrospina]MCF8723756.1 ribosomal protein L7/L12 [Nitrospina sp. Nb-3]
MEQKEILNKCREDIKNGKNQDDIIRFLRQADLPPIEAIKVFKKLYGVSVGESKEKVMGHPSWRELAKDGDKLHDEIIKTLEQELNDND